MLQFQRALRYNAAVMVRSSGITSQRGFCKDYASSSDDEKEPKKKNMSKPKETAKKPEEETAALKLNRLLASMQTEGSSSLTQKSMNMAKPGEGFKKRKEAAKRESNSKDIFSAAKNVALMLAGGNEEGQKQAESELLAKLLGHKLDVEGPKEGKIDETTKPLDEMSLSEIIVGMKIDRSKHPKTETRAEFVRRSLASKRQHFDYLDDKGFSRTKQRRPPRTEPEAYTGSVDLFGGEPLGIFTDVKSLQDSEDVCKTWAYLQQRELEMQIERPPANYFEKVALWTKQGKVWRFPIDNEQDWTDEINVDFSEHIFLEQHLESWCPSKGPIRHFMELVCVGLSKNPYTTAKEKKEHILWYRDYFMAKKDILQDLIDEKKLSQTSVNSGQSDKSLEA